MTPDRILPMPDPTDDDDPESVAAFEKYLEKYGTKWLEKLRPLVPSPSLDDKKPSTTEPTLTSFLQDALKEAKDQSKTLSERLEAALAQMTPEQLTLFRLQLKSPPGPGGPGKEDPIKKPADDIPKPKKKPWL